MYAHGMNAFSRSSSQSFFLICLAAVSLVYTHSVQAQMQDIEAWAHEQWNKARFEDIPIPVDVLIEYDTVQFSTVSQAQIEAWRNEVENKPDHPLRHQLELESRRLQRGGDIQHWSIVRGELGWRHSRHTDDGFYADTGKHGSRMWLLSPSQLVDSSGAAEPGGPHDLSNMATTASADLMLLLYGGLGGGESIGRSIESVHSIDQNQWLLSAPANGNFPLAEFTIALTNQPHPYAVTSLEYIDSDGHPVESYTFENWKFIPELGGNPIAFTIKNYRDSRLVKEYRITGISTLTSEECQKLTRTPDIGRPDPLRGPLTVNRVVRDTSAQTTYSRLRPDGTSDVTVYTPDSPAKLSRLRTLGWISAGSIIVGIALYKLYRKGQ